MLWTDVKKPLKGGCPPEFSGLSNPVAGVTATRKL